VSAFATLAPIAPTAAERLERTHERNRRSHAALRERQRQRKKSASARRAAAIYRGEDEPIDPGDLFKNHFNGHRRKVVEADDRRAVQRRGGASLLDWRFSR
jgi:hypothetical protein